MAHHPSKSLIGEKSKLLENKRIVLGICGSIAAIRAPEIARELMRHGATIFTVMTEMATKIIHPYTMEWATGNPVVTKLTGKIEHVSLIGEETHFADLYLIAPATANTISKIASGIDDTPVTSVATVALGAEIPIVIVPAMHKAMYDNPFVVASIRKLKEAGVMFVDPLFEENKAKIAPTNEILLEVFKAIFPKDFNDKKILITGGPTREFLDPIRFISNPSSGKMGISLAEIAYARGADVTLVLGPTEASLPRQIKVIHVTSANEMYTAVMNELSSKQYDIFISSAAVADYTPSKKATSKIRSGSEVLSIELKSTPKIIREAKRNFPNLYVVGFKAEHKLSNKQLIEISLSKIREYHIDMIVANDTSREFAGFGKDYNEVIVVTKSKKTLSFGPSHKLEIAYKIFNVIKEDLKK
ncbi:MAG: bifunctional phosphopantothenoylcysteine decarboxylase/phosphopantothenate--cysteine ligase CoaBC [Candidatus Asgardarchaeia archaeon]